MDTKRCKYCDQIKSIIKFHFNYTRVDGTRTRGSKCKACHNSRVKEYYKEHKAECYERSQNWRKTHLARHREMARRSYWRNVGIERARHSYHNHRRRTVKYSNGRCDKGITLDKVYVRDDYTCGICNNFCSLDDASLDHITPLSRGGTHTWDNVQLAHLLCNIGKGARV